VTLTFDLLTSELECNVTHGMGKPGLLGLGLEAFGLGLVFLAVALFKAKVKVTNKRKQY